MRHRKPTRRKLLVPRSRNVLDLVTAQADAHHSID
jgi:hypothetical protein